MRWTRLAPVLLATLTAAGLVAVGGATAQPGGDIGSKQAEAKKVLAQIDAALARSRAHLAAVQHEQAALEALGQARKHLLISATASMTHAQRDLDEQLRALYEHAPPDPIAVLLGAQSLDDAITGLDNLQRVARQSRAIVHETRATRNRLNRLLGQLEQQRRRLEALRVAAAAETSSLEASAGSKQAYIASLQQQRAVNTAELVALEHQAAQAAGKNASAAASVSTTVSAPGPAATTTTATATTPTTSGARTLTVTATAYALPGHTATGLPVGHGIAAVDPSVIPLGTRFDVPGYGLAVAADVGSGIRGNMIDLWFPTVRAANNWGRRTVTITFR